MPRSLPRMQSPSAPVRTGEVYFEFQYVGQAVRVAAVDAKTGTEVVIMGPATASQDELQRVALQKLKTQMARALDTRKR